MTILYRMNVKMKKLSMVNARVKSLLAYELTVQTVWYRIRKYEIPLMGTETTDQDQLQAITADKKRKCDLLDELYVLNKAQQDI